MVPFAGWEMPVQYEGVIAEHKAVRTDAGVFDVSHMGQFHVEGPNAHELLQSLPRTTSTRSATARRSTRCSTNERGGIVDDLIAYRINAHHYLVVVNAGNRDAAYAWMKEREIRGSEIRDASTNTRLAVQGPRALERLGSPEAKPFTHAMGELDGVEVMVNRTGYTGEQGVELMCPAEDAERSGTRSPRAASPCRARRARHAPARGLLPAARERHHRGHRRDLGRSRLDVRASARSSAAPPSCAGSRRRAPSGSWSPS